MTKDFTNDMKDLSPRANKIIWSIAIVEIIYLCFIYYSLPNTSVLPFVKTNSESVFTYKLKLMFFPALVHVSGINETEELRYNATHNISPPEYKDYAP